MFFKLRSLLLTALVILLSGSYIFTQSFDPEETEEAASELKPAAQKNKTSEQDEDDEDDDDDDEEEDDDDEEEDDDDEEETVDSEQRETDIDTDEMPFNPTTIDQNDKNVFGNKAYKDAVLKNMEYQLGFTAEGSVFNNADLRNLNEDTQSAIDETDDKASLAVSRFFVNFYFPISSDLFFRVDLFKNGFWGHDQLSGGSSNNDSSSTAIGSDPFNFGELYVESVFISQKSHSFSMRVGRQFFSIGGLPQEFILKDYLDAVTFKVEHKSIGSFRILAADVFHMGADATEQINYVSLFSHDDERIDNFDGDVNTLRTGMVYDSLNLLNWQNKSTSNHYDLRAKLYGFYARYGAVNGNGADLSNDGSTGNFADNDYTVLAGNRFLFSGKKLFINDHFSLYADVAVSSGVDRRPPTAAAEPRDIENSGLAFGGGGSYTIEKLLPVLDMHFAIDFFQAQGATYNSDGVQTSHGFVSFKGSQMGGLLVNRYWGAHPTAYTDDDGIDNNPHDYNRKSGTMVLHGQVASTLYDKYKLGFDVWLMKDNSSSGLDNSQAQTVSQKAQSRLGKMLGLEWNLSLDYYFNEYYTLYAKGGMFLPGAFYETPGTVSNTPYGSDAFWGAQLGSKLLF